LLALAQVLRHWTEDVEDSPLPPCACFFSWSGTDLAKGVSPRPRTTSLYTAHAASGGCFCPIEPGRMDVSCRIVARLGVFGSPSGPDAARSAFRQIQTDRLLSSQAFRAPVVERLRTAREV